MAVSDHLSVVNKLRGVVTTVDPGNMVLEVTCQDRQPRRIFLADIPSGFVWPKEGEQWSIYEENGYWRLGNRFPQGDDDFHISQMDPGEGMIPDVLWTPIGNKVEFNDDFDAQSTNTTLSSLSQNYFDDFLVRMYRDMTVDSGTGENRGTASAESGALGGSWYATNNNGTGLLDVSMNAYQNCWWSVSASCILRTDDAAWVRVDPLIRLTGGNDARGVTYNDGPISILSTHQALSWQGVTLKALFKCTGNAELGPIGYQARIFFSSGAVNWHLYYGTAFLSIQSEVVGFW